LLVLKDIVVRYGHVEVVKGVSLEVGSGSVTTLIGANGAGKSTCLRAISGLQPIDSGEIWFEDKRIDGLRPERVAALHISHAPEGKQLFLNMRVSDNLLVGAFLRKDRVEVQKDLQRMYEYFPALVRARRRPASSLSGGEQQMLAIARSLMSRPKLMLLDEPSLGLSPILTQEIASIISTIAEQGVSILLIEQNASMALSLATKAYVLETGRVVLAGTSAQLRDNEHVREAYLGI
jgi:branched-chain amino acid transport system ATP-binding protein